MQDVKHKQTCRVCETDKDLCQSYRSDPTGQISKYIECRDCLYLSNKEARKRIDKRKGTK